MLISQLRSSMSVSNDDEELARAIAMSLEGVSTSASGDTPSVKPSRVRKHY